MKRLIISSSLVLLFMSCSEIIMLDDISKENIHILAPVDGALINGNTVVFTWQKNEDAQKYTIQIAQPNFTNAIKILTDSTTIKLNFKQELETGEYQWRVRGENTGYHTSYSTQSIIIE